MSHHDINQHQEPHVIPLSIYLGVGGALIFLTIFTVVSAQFDFSHMLGIDHLNIIIAMIIATIKASLVALFFMHLIYDKKIYLTVFMVALLTLGIFLALTLFDTMRRGEPYVIEQAPIKKSASIYDDRSPKPDASPSH